MQSEKIQKRKNGPGKGRSWHFYVGWSILLCSMMIFLGACSKYRVSQTGEDNAPKANLTPTVTEQTPTPTPTFVPQAINLQVEGCPALSINWDQLVGAKDKVSKVQKVICGTIGILGVQGAIVQLRYYTPDAKMDFFVYNNLYAPQKLFEVKGMLNGDAKFSPLGTIVTAEASSGKGTAYPRDIFKEYQWNYGANKFVQVMFPGMFPDVTHYQAMQNQDLVYKDVAAGVIDPITGRLKGDNMWRTEFKTIAKRFAVNVLHWNPDMVDTATIVYQGKEGLFQIQVLSLAPGGGGFIAEMFELDGHVDYHTLQIRKVTSIDGTVLMEAPRTQHQVASPVTVSGTCPANGSVLGRVVIYNNQLIAVGEASIASPTPSGTAQFTKTVDFKLNKRGVQEGVVAFYWTNQNSTNTTSQVTLAKVLLDG